jgi:hypothetical protein
MQQESDESVLSGHSNLMPTPPNARDAACGGGFQTGSRFARPLDRIQFEKDVEAGDFIYVPPFAPHQEINPSPDTPSQRVIVRNSQEPIVVNLEPFDGAPS